MANDQATSDASPSGLATVAAEALSPSLIAEISRIPTPEESTESMAQEQFDADLIVIGSGPGGYHAAIRAAQLGASVICVEREYLGGTCLNWGCIPSKAMIAATERLHHVKHAGDFGVVIEGEIKFDFPKMMAKHKEKVVLAERGGIGMLFKKNKIRHVEGFAKFTDPHTISVDKDGNKQSLRGKKFVLAMGSSVIRLNIPGLENTGREDGVWTSDDAVTAPFVPEKMLVLGGGAVGCEFSFVFNGLGSEVHLLEMMPNLLPVMDTDLGTELGKLLTRQGVKVKTGASLERAERTANGWKCTVKRGTETEEIEVNVILLGVGRKAATEGVGLEEIGVKLHRRGVEIADDTMITHVPHIWAIGDVTGRIQLAHTAMHEGIVAAHNAVQGTQKRINFKAVPNAVYTSPEVASVGLTEGEAKEKGYDVVVGRSKFMIFGKAMATKETDGFVKVVADRKYGELLGVHMLGAHVTDMIHEAVVAINLEATLESLADSIHAHPTMSEAVLEAVEDALGHAIHKL
ncbi:MAG: dihydrolipoyl dehydrogenase [Fimbriimonadaceae bacterium]|nr:dihydrolipoyl dehydrogenase [Fimbriimonadaceae bacterium]